METIQKNDKKLTTAWAFYDWANSVYPLVITSTIFPIYYESVTRNGTSDIVTFLGVNLKNTALYTYALAFAYLVIAVLSPMLSGIADYSGNKKKFMQFFCYLGATACSLMFFFTSENLWLGIVLIVVACIGYSGSIVFYNAYLPEIADNSYQNKVSAKGFALGYTGSSILLIFNLTLVLNPEWYGISSTTLASRIAFLLVGVWWALFAQIPFYYLPDNLLGQDPGGNYLSKGYEEIRKVWVDLKKNTRLKKFLSAFFVYNMGVQTVMLVATLFGKKELGLEAGQLITTILLIQFIAIGGAYLFAYVSKIKSNLFTLKIAVIIWIGVCAGAYFTRTAGQFYIIAVVVGLVMGGIQSLSRSTYSKMLPETTDHASYFSFYDVCEKTGIVLGMALFGLIETLTDNMRNPVIALISFFIFGFVLLLRIPTKGEQKT